MAEFSTPEERTEMPTDRRMGQLRRKGQIFFSNDVVQVLSLMSGYFVLVASVGSMLTHMQFVLRYSFGLIARDEKLSFQMVGQVVTKLMRVIGPDVFFIALFVAMVSALAVMLQTQWNVKPEWIHFEWPHINPLAGIKRIFSISGFVNVFKALAKLALILPIGYFGLKALSTSMISLVHFNVEEILAFTGKSLDKLFWRILYVLIALAIFDYVWGRFQWLKSVKMTKSEVKDERKALEGDEETKRKIQAKGLQRIAQRIRESVPQADVVVTNPTHFAVALKYDRLNMGAPIVVAKGKDFLAQRIKLIAREAGVPVLERKMLARALYASTEVGSEIPYDLFKAVAEVLAYVYKLKNPHGSSQRTPQGAPAR